MRNFIKKTVASPMAISLGVALLIFFIALSLWPVDVLADVLDGMVIGVALSIVILHSRPWVRSMHKRQPDMIDLMIAAGFIIWASIFTFRVMRGMWRYFDDLHWLANSWVLVFVATMLVYAGLIHIVIYGHDVERGVITKRGWIAVAGTLSFSLCLGLLVRFLVAE